MTPELEAFLQDGGDLQEILAIEEFLEVFFP